MKVTVPPPDVTRAKSASPATAPAAKAPMLAVPAAVASAPVPVVGAAKAPPSVEARLTGAAEKSLRSILGQIKEDVSPKALTLAINKMTAHPRQDVHYALKAMLGGDAEAVAKFVKTDRLDFARAELKAIAAKCSARALDAAEREADLIAGLVAGMTPLPAPPLFQHAFEYALGQRMGACVGLAADAAAFLVGSGMTGGGAVLAPVTGGLSTGLSAAGLAVAGGAVAAAAFHGSRWLEPQLPAVYEARATALGPQPKELNETHIFKGEVKQAVKRPSPEIKMERASLITVKKSRPLTSSELKVFEKERIRSAQGFHLESAGGENARVIESTRTPLDRNGVYMANVEIRDPMTGQWIRKEAKSTFFPSSYSEDDVRRALDEAYQKAEPLGGGAWVGTSQRGLKILFVVDVGDVVPSTYPLMDPLP